MPSLSPGLFSCIVPQMCCKDRILCAAQKLITSLSISLHKKIHSLSYYPRAKVLCFYTYYLQTLNKKPSKLSVLTF